MLLSKMEQKHKKLGKTDIMLNVKIVDEKRQNEP